MHTDKETGIPVSALSLNKRVQFLSLLSLREPLQSPLPQFVLHAKLCNCGLSAKLFKRKRSLSLCLKAEMAVYG